MSQLLSFNGGLSNRLSPQFIQATEGVIFKNIDITSGNLTPAKNVVDSGLTSSKYFYKFNDTIISSASRSDYLEYQKVLYYTEDGTYPKKFDGTNTYRLGIVGPEVLPITTLDILNGTLDATYQYCYTYYNENDGTESKPSPYTEETYVEFGIRFYYVASLDPQVTHIRIYRIGGVLTAMTLVTQVNNIDSSYLDILGDLEVDGTLLESYTYYEAPDNLKYLVESYAIMFGAVDETLWFSYPGAPNNWSPLQTIEFDATITGIGILPEGILIFTEFKTYIITGTSSDTFIKYLVSTTQGCINHYSIQFIQGNIIWLSYDGICSTDGSSIQVISLDKLGSLSLDIESSLVYKDVYYLSTSEKLLCLDMRYTAVFTEFDVFGDVLGVIEDTLYIHNNGKLYEMFAGEDLTLSYRSGRFTDSSLILSKNYSEVKVRSIGDLIIKTYVDEVLVSSNEISTDIISTEDITMDRSKQTGFSIEFEIEGTGTVYELTYKVS